MESYFGNRENSLGYLTSVVSRLLANQLNRRFAEAGIALTIEQWAVLYSLWDKNGLTQQEIAAGLHLEKSTVSRALVALERDGWVRREKDPDDARLKRVFVTAKADAVRRGCGELAHGVLDEAQEALNDDERRTLHALLGRVLHSLLEMSEG
jgi:DNA-binding MarR family transcriptional regulator